MNSAFLFLLGVVLALLAPSDAADLRARLSEQLDSTLTTYCASKENLTEGEAYVLQGETGRRWGQITQQNMTLFNATCGVICPSKGSCSPTDFNYCFFMLLKGDVITCGMRSTPAPVPFTTGCCCHWSSSGSAGSKYSSGAEDQAQCTARCNKSCPAGEQCSADLVPNSFQCPPTPAPIPTPAPVPGNIEQPTGCCCQGSSGGTTVNYFTEPMTSQTMCDTLCDEKCTLQGVTCSAEITGRDQCQLPAECFHKDTVVTYQNQDYTLPELLAEKQHECRVPHVVTSTRGVVVKAACPSGVKSLQLTGDHLLFSDKGMKAAGDLRVGEDFLFEDVGEQAACPVTAVDASPEAQEYFGVNCYNSVVFANGLKASTFEKYHALPAMWMETVGRIFGLELAGEWGQQIVESALKFLP